MQVHKRQPTLFELLDRARASPDAQDHCSDRVSPTPTPGRAAPASTSQNTCAQPTQPDKNTPKRCMSVTYDVARPSRYIHPPRLHHSTTSSKRSKSQLHLDLGQVGTPVVHHTLNHPHNTQKLIGCTKCTECGMVYTVGQPDDAALHAKYHKAATQAIPYHV